MRLLTFDIEDYHRLLDIPGLIEQYDESKSIVVSETQNILDILKKNKVKAIFFVLGEVAAKFPNVVRSIVADGHALGTHSHKHILHKDLSDNQFVDDLRQSINAIESVSGTKVRCYRAPGFSLQKEYFYRYSLMKAEGIDFDFSLFDGVASHGGVDMGNVQNLPLRFETSFGDVESYPFKKSSAFGFSLPILGGGYFRLSPTWLISRVLRSHGYIMTYFHPRDFSLEQPRLKNLSLIRYFKAYVGLRGASQKLNKLVGSNEWSGVEKFK